MRRQLRIGMVLAGAAMVLAGAATAGAQSTAAPPPAPTDPIVSVTVDLAARSFNRVLPFDVPFFITGQAPDGTVRLEVQYTERRGRDTVEPPVWRPAAPALWLPDEAASSGDTFLVFMRDTLDAERYFQFRFTFVRQPSAEQASRFRADARSLFDERLALVGGNAVPLADAREMRDSLAAIVRSVAGTSQWEPVRGSTFDTADASAKAMLAFLENAVPVLGPQVERGEILADFVTVRLALRTDLAALQASKGLNAAVAAARQVDDPALNELLKVDAAGLALLALSPVQIDLAAAGGVAGDLGDSWRPEGPAARAANFAQLARDLRQLDHFAAAVSDTGAARPIVEKIVGAAAIAEIAALRAPGGALTGAIERTERLSADLNRLASALTDRDAALAKLTDLIVVVLRDERFVEGTTIADGATTQRNYVSADGGLLYAGDIGRAALFIGSNIYLRPVNKDAPLSQKGSFFRRFAFTVGLTVNSIEDDNSATRTDLFGDSSLVLGAGLRITESIRAGAGALVFQESDPNPLVTKKSAASTWYLSFSFDMDVAKTLQGLGGEFE